ncbi:hypothetical protein [Sporosarcina sp. JAI121]|uniref:hypothetical protein n=1 Tax=Sporosarcina sp. JAI121 TaxID=2723064 RepID=UPI00178F1907|nr:hypothetical protein [Sporosarcina sp. JAI121]NYF26261.1 hypothetical protein [Sporosarcina sp. JAI121]
MADFIWPVINLTGISPTLNSMFDRLQTAEATPLFNYTSNYGISALRDVISTLGSGTVTNTQGFYQLSTSPASNASAILDTAERGKLFPGNSFEAGVSIRVPVAPTGTQKPPGGILMERMEPTLVKTLRVFLSRFSTAASNYSRFISLHGMRIN